MPKIEREGPTHELVVGLDLGTTKTTCLIAELSAEGGLSVVGVGTAPSAGMRKGVVVNIESTVDSIQKAVREAERMAGVKVQSAYVGVGGDHIKGMTSNGVIAVSRKDKEIQQEDVDRVIEAAKAIAIPQDREIIHVLSQEYIIDNQDGIKDPIGMSGVRLEAVVHVVTGSSTAVQNVVKSVERAGLAVDDLVLQSMASAHAVLTPDERELGVALVDIGGGTTDVVIFLEGAVRYTGVIPVGGNQLTRDVAIGLRTPNDEAEDLKRRLGTCMGAQVDEGEEITVAGVGGRSQRSIPRRLLAEILQPRMEEVVGMLDGELKKSRFDGRLAAGIVLTGGQAQLDGTLPLAENVLRQQVRLGKPHGVTGLADVVGGPEFSAAVGLVVYGAKAHQQGFSSGHAGPAASGPGILERLKRALSEYF
jgi:cell division protein FtsA